MGHATDVLILSRLRVGVSGCGEVERVCPGGIGLGRAMVAISRIREQNNVHKHEGYTSEEHVRS